MTLVRHDRLVEMGVVSNRVDTARKIANLEFPRPIALGARSVAWDLTEVEQWIASRPRKSPKYSAPSARLAKP